MRAHRRDRTRRALLVLVPATVDAAVAAGVVIARTEAGQGIPAYGALAGVAVTVAVGLVTLTRERTTVPRPVKVPAPVALVPPVAVAQVDEYVDTLLADLAV